VCAVKETDAFLGLEVFSLTKEGKGMEGKTGVAGGFLLAFIFHFAYK